MGSTVQGICPVRRKDGVILLYEKNKKLGRGKFTSSDLEIRIRKMASNKIKDIWPKIGLY
jgi:hypothetical protein